MPLRPRTLPPINAEPTEPTTATPSEAPETSDLTPSGRPRFKRATTPDTSSSIDPRLVGVGGLAGVAALTALLKNPQAAGRVLQGVQDLRMTSMLSGLAAPKSILGNLGAGVYSSIERGSLAPLKEMLSLRTLKDAGTAFKEGAQIPPNATPLAKLNVFGRTMGAFDTAGKNALVRSGLTEEEAARKMLQAPLPAQITKQMANPVAQYLVPFQKIPFNQLFEGLGSFNALKPGGGASVGEKVALATSLGTGAATGYLAEDPKTVALGTAFSGQRGLPFAAAASLGRLAQTGNPRKAADVIQGMSPVSDYSLSQGVIGGPLVNPLNVIPKPAAFSAYEYLKKMFGVE